jgi:hypothetical protein
VELHLVLKLVLLRQEEPVEAVERKFEVIMYGTKEEEVLYDPKGQSKKSKKALVYNNWPCQERIYLPWIYHGRIITNGTLAI